MQEQSLFTLFKRYRTVQTHKIRTLPIVILMPHSACNCKCVMCDIWKGNRNLKQLSTDDVSTLLSSLKELGTREVVMSGGEALLNTNFFRLCELLQNANIEVSLLSTGLLLKKNADQLLKFVNRVIVSLDGDEVTHNAIRNIDNAYGKLLEGVRHIKSLNPNYEITGRTVIHRLNYQKWLEIIESAKEIGLDQISFLPADISSEAFNRETRWDEERQAEIIIPEQALTDLERLTEELIIKYKDEFDSHYIAESPEKIRKIFGYYAAVHGKNDFPYKKCNAPWVSTVIDADGTVRPCFFHPVIGNIRDNSLENILNSKESIAWRKNLDMAQDSTCVKCVCYLNLPLTLTHGK